LLVLARAGKATGGERKEREENYNAEFELSRKISSPYRKGSGC